MWNQVKARLSVPARDAVVLYLAAEQDEDRDIAVSKGFRAHNMIAVDKSPAIVRQLRADGKLALDADVHGLLATWSPDRAVHVVALDYCCGLTAAVRLSMPHLTMMPHLADAVFMVNMLRGRDPATNEDRASTAKWSNVNAKHRGQVLFSMLLEAWSIGICGGLSLNDLGEICRNDASLNGWTDEHGARLAKLLRHSRPFTHHYRSTSRQTFDSVVFRSPVAAFDLAPENLSDVLRSKWAGHPLRRKSAAILAHRTRRIQEVA